MLKNVTALAAAFALAAVSLPSFAAPSATPAARTATPASATAAAVKPKVETALGQISSLDTHNLTMVLKVKSRSETFSVPSTAKITAHGKPIEIGGLEVGEKVEVSYAREGGSMVATRVALLGHA